MRLSSASAAASSSTVLMPKVSHGCSTGSAQDFLSAGDQQAGHRR